MKEYSNPDKLSSVAVYDYAVVSLFKQIFKNSVYQEPELVLKTVTDTVGEVKLPLISIFRPDGWTLASQNNDVAIKNFVNGMQFLYVNFRYQIDLWANTREDLEQLATEIVLFLARNPGIKVTYYSADGSSCVDVNISLKYFSGPDRTNERLDDTTLGRLYRYTFVYTVLNAGILAFQPDKENAGNQGDDGRYPSGYVPTILQVVAKVIAYDSINSVGKVEETVTVKGDINEHGDSD